VSSGYNPLGVGAIASSVSTLHDGWHRYTSPTGYTIDFPDGYAPRVVDPLPGSGSTASIANYNAQRLAPRTADRVRVLISELPSTVNPTSLEQLRAQYTAIRAQYPQVGELNDVLLGPAVRLSIYVHDSEGYNEMSYYACSEQRSMCYTLSSSDPGFTEHKDLVEQIVSTFTLH
jgi:hypothetical protein